MIMAEGVLLGGSWDLVTSSISTYDLAYNPVTWPYRGYPSDKEGYDLVVNSSY